MPDLTYLVSLNSDCEYVCQVWSIGLTNNCVTHGHQSKKWHSICCCQKIHISMHEDNCKWPHSKRCLFEAVCSPNHRLHRYTHYVNVLQFYLIHGNIFLPIVDNNIWTLPTTRCLIPITYITVSNIMHPSFLPTTPIFDMTPV